MQQRKHFIQLRLLPLFPFCLTFHTGLKPYATFDQRVGNTAEEGSSDAWRSSIVQDCIFSIMSISSPTVVTFVVKLCIF